jgi:hypothetical protein
MKIFNLNLKTVSLGKTIFAVLHCMIPHNKLARFNLLKLFYTFYI